MVKDSEVNTGNFPVIYDNVFVEEVDQFRSKYSKYAESRVWEGLVETFGKDAESRGLADLLNLQIGTTRNRFLSLLMYYSLIKAYIKQGGILKPNNIKKLNDLIYSYLPFGNWVASYFVYWKTFWDSFATLLSVSYFFEPGKFIDKKNYERSRLCDISSFYRNKVKVKEAADSIGRLRKLEELGIEEEDSTFYKCKEYRDRVVHKYLDALVFCGYEASGFYPAPPFLHDWSDEAKEDLKMKINGVDKGKGVLLVREFVDTSEIIELVNASFEQVCETVEYFASK